jgi:hypothetical protein
VETDHSIETAPAGRKYSLLALTALILTVAGGARFFLASPDELWPTFVALVAAAVAIILGIAAIIHIRFSKGTRKGHNLAIIAILGAVLVLVLGGFCIMVASVFGLNDRDPAYVLNRAELAPLPANASGAKAASRQTPGEIRFWAKFTADKDGIVDLLNESKSLTKKVNDVFKEGHVHTPYVGDINKWLMNNREEPPRWWEVIYGSDNPPWYRPEVCHGRLYVFNGKAWGLVLIDDDRNEVYVFMYTH